MVFKLTSIPGDMGEQYIYRNTTFIKISYGFQVNIHTRGHGGGELIRGDVR